MIRVVGKAQDGGGSPDQPYGLRVEFHSGAKVFGVFRHTLASGQRAGEATAFQQREAI